MTIVKSMTLSLVFLSLMAWAIDDEKFKNFKELSDNHTTELMDQAIRNLNVSPPEYDTDFEIKNSVFLEELEP